MRRHGRPLQAERGVTRCGRDGQDRQSQNTPEDCDQIWNALLDSPKTFAAGDPCTNQDSLFEQYVNVWDERGSRVDSEDMSRRHKQFLHKLVLSTASRTFLVPISSGGQSRSNRTTASGKTSRYSLVLAPGVPTAPRRTYAKNAMVYGLSVLFKPFTYFDLSLDEFCIHVAICDPIGNTYEDVPLLPGL